MYGHPLQTELFDIGPPAAVSKPALTGLASYASAVTGSGAVAEATKAAGEDADLLRDVGVLEKGFGRGFVDAVSRHVFGLLDVEPLNYTCHTASDGTRLERDDLGKCSG